MFSALERDGFGYDCTWVSRTYGYLDLGNILISNVSHIIKS